jgi:integrase
MAQIKKRTTAGGEDRWDVRTRIGGRVVTRSFRTKREATAHGATIESDKLRGVAIDPRRSRITLEVFGTRWLAGRHDLAATTADLYRYLFADHIVPALGDTELGSLTPSAVRSWNASLRRRHPTTAAKAYRLLSTMMKAAVDDDRLVRNPCRVSGAATEVAPERPVASIAEVQALADAMRDDQRIAVILAAWCQLRRGEVLGLRRGDVDLLHGTVRIESTKVRTMGGAVVTKAPKSDAGRRVVAIPPNITDELADHLARHTGAGRDALLLAKGSKPLRGAWERARKAVGVDYRFHDLRHSGLTWAAATGATTAELMHRAGHRSAEAAMHYQHATEDRDRALAAALAAYVPPAEVVTLENARFPRDGRAMEGGGAKPTGGGRGH